MNSWYEFQVDPKKMAKERQKARELRQSQWWKTLLSQGRCHYCEGRFSSSELTMDHIVPLARGGVSTKGNIVPSCKDCNQKKKLHTPAEMLLNSLSTPPQNQ